MMPGPQEDSAASDFGRGAALLARLSPTNVPPPWESFADIAPLLGHSVGVAFGRIMDRPALDLRTRELITVAILAALGGCEPQVTFHAAAALRAGATAPELVEALTQLSVYAGIPRALNAVAALRPAFGAASVDGTVDTPRTAAWTFLQGLASSDVSNVINYVHQDLDWGIPASSHPLGGRWLGASRAAEFVHELHSAMLACDVQLAEPLVTAELVYVPMSHSRTVSSRTDSILQLQTSAGLVVGAKVYR